MFTLKDIEKITNGKIINGDGNTIINKYSTAKKTFNQGIFYVPIIFKKQNREEFILEAVKNGAIGFMINEDSINYEKIINEALKINPNIIIVAVSNVNVALFNLGLEARKLNITKEVIAITGSFGKSTLTNMIAKVLATEMKVLYDFNNGNNNTKSFLSRLLQEFDNYEIAVLELGTANPGRITDMSKLVKPSIAVINSIGTAHINNFLTKENILEEKMHIVDYLKDKKILYVNSDDEYLQNIKESKEYNLQKYCLNEAWNIKETSSGISFTTKIYDEEINFSLNLYGIYFIRNIILTIKIAEIYKIKSENIIKAINDFKPIDGRFKVLKNNDITIIDDTFNSCYESVIEGLNITNKMSSKRKIAILGTIGSGANGKDDTSLTHEKVGDYFKNLNFDYLFLIGDYTKHTYKSALKYFPVKNIKRFKSKDALLKELKYLIKEGDLLYLKDAGFQELEEIVEELKTTFNLI